MKRFKDRYAVIILGIFISMIGVACSSSGKPVAPGGSDTGIAADGDPSAGIETDEQPDAESSIDNTADTAESVESDLGPESDSEFAWTMVQVGEGIKPALDIDADGTAHIAFLTEAEHGAVFYASNESGEFTVETVSEGYFYGPVDIALSVEGLPYIAYHDHQDQEFKPTKGDEVVAILNGGRWGLITVSDDGHDGWDNSIVVDSDGNWHTASVDPAQFGSSDGVEYATNIGGVFEVTSVSDGPVVYEFGTSIGLDAQSRPAISYYDDAGQQLAYASLDDNGWSVQVVDGDGDAGRYSSLVFDSSGNPHISYYVATSANAGTVRHAWWDGADWQVEDVGTLDDVQMGHTGARKITSLAIGPDDRPRIAFTDRSRVMYGIQGDSGWALQDVTTSPESTLGQLVELALDNDGKPHLTWFDVTSPAPLNGEVIYAFGS